MRLGRETNTMTMTKGVGGIITIMMMRTMIGRVITVMITTVGRAIIRPIPSGTPGTAVQHTSRCKTASASRTGDIKF